MKKLLIANRGEIAVRVAQACKDLGVISVGIYAASDQEALHVKRCDEAYELSGSTLAETYLNPQQIVDLAQRVGADAVHPGYGFLSENAEFAELVETSGLIWIGPPPAVIRSLGDKVSARSVAVAANAPVVAATDGIVQDTEEVLAFVGQHGLPIAIKASHGGGGRGMRVVWHQDEVEAAFASAQREALLAFGNSDCYVEKYLHRPRHLEVQIIADNYNNVVAVGTRDCSLQRRFQKLIEEAPAPFLPDDIEKKAIEAAKNIAREVGYRNAGTVEFLLSEDGELAFLEVNTRLQVEHSVSEEAYGVDLVAEQLNVARGEALGFETDLRPLKHAIEFRIIAEDPGRGFLPTPGTISQFIPPMGPSIRVDSAFERSGEVQPEYDSLIAKLIVSGHNRADALMRSKRAISEMVIHGIPTVLPFHARMLEESDFTGTNALHVHTRWVEDDMDFSFTPDPVFDMNYDPSTHREFIITVDGRARKIGLPGSMFQGFSTPPLEEDHSHSPTRNYTNNSLVADMSGTVTRIFAHEGMSLQKGEPVLTMEVMKMERVVHAPQACTVETLTTAVGAWVTPGDQLVKFRD